MYRTVYYHKTTRSAEVMLKKLFTRYQELLRLEDSAEGRLQLVPQAPAAVCRAFESNMSLQDYLLLDDHTVTEFAKACRNSTDSIMANLAQGLLERKLFKALDVTQVNRAKVAKIYECVKEVVKEHDFSEKYFFDEDTPSDTSYKIYNPDDENPATQIYIKSLEGKQEELSRVSENVANLTKSYDLLRYYFPEKARSEVLARAAPLLSKG